MTSDLDFVQFGSEMFAIGVANLQTVLNVGWSVMYVLFLSVKPFFFKLALNSFEDNDSYIYHTLFSFAKGCKRW